MTIAVKPYVGIDTVVVTANGKVSIPDIIKSIDQIRLDRVGNGLGRHLLDLSTVEIVFTINEGRGIILALQKMASILGTKKIAIIFAPIHSDYILEKLATLVDHTHQDIRFFTDKPSAIHFLKRI